MAYMQMINLVMQQIILKDLQKQYLTMVQQLMLLLTL